MDAIGGCIAGKDMINGSANTHQSMTPTGNPNISNSCIEGESSVIAGGGKTKTKKIMYDLSENDDFDREEIATYEEVARLFPRPGVFRPVVLIGPPGVGRNELKRRLIALDPERYKATVPRKFVHKIIQSFLMKGNRFLYQNKE